MVAAPFLLVALAASILSATAAPHKRAPASDADSYWVSTSSDVHLPPSSATATPAAPLRAAPLPAATATPTAPAPALVTSLALSAELQALAKRGAPFHQVAPLLERQLGASSSPVDIHSLYLSIVRSRASSGELPTPWTPGQSARASAMAASRASVTSSMVAAGTCRVTADCVRSVPANANKYCDEGVCSYRCRSGFEDTGSSCVSPSSSTTTPPVTTTTTTKKTTTSTRTTTTTTTSSASATQTCAVSSDCTNSIPPNANRYCADGQCLYRCRSGFEASGSSCVAASSSSSSASTTTTRTTTRATTTTTTAPPSTQTCSLTSDCSNDVPGNANRYCADGVCSYRCRSGFEESGSACVAAATSSTTTASATTTTTAPPSTQTCALTSDCSNDVPANANRYCADNVCSYRCRSGFDDNGSSCVTPTLTSATTTTTAAPSTQTCALTSDCSNTVPSNANRYCDNSVCSFRCRSGFTESGSACVAETTTTTSVAPEATQTCSVTAECTNTIPAYANRYCDNGVCSFRCRYGYTASGSTCVYSGLGGSSGTSWTQDPSFSTLAEFKSDVINSGRFSWGDTQGNVAVVPDGVPASGWTGGVKGDSQPALQVRYPAGSRNPSFEPVGGMGFYTSQIDVSTATNVSFSYSLFFEDGFDFVKGGKLPGLYGGKSACSGGSAAENCFSARLMFRKGGAGELYLYAPREKQVDALCELGPLSYCNSVYGMSIGRGSWTFKTGEWTDIRQDIWLNTPGVADGGFNIWINGELVLSSSQVYYRNSAVGNIGTGPSNSSVVPPIDYDALSDSVTIPNGGFKPSNETGVFNPSFVTKVVGPTATAAAEGYEDANGDITATSLPYDWEVRRARQRRRNVVPLATPTPTSTLVARRVVELDKRADTVATTVPGFLGAMCQTFFGGSSTDYNSPTLQYSYFRGFGLRINA